MELEEMAIGYATQTNNLRINKKAIKEASWINQEIKTFWENGQDDYISLGKFRDAYYEDDTEDQCYNVVWETWVNCLNTCGMDFTDKEMDLATLLDERKMFVQARAKFKRLLYYKGNKLINKEA